MKINEKFLRIVCENILRFANWNALFSFDLLFTIGLFGGVSENLRFNRLQKHQNIRLRIVYKFCNARKIRDISICFLSIIVSVLLVILLKMSAVWWFVIIK